MEFRSVWGTLDFSTLGKSSFFSIVHLPFSKAPMVSRTGSGLNSGFNPVCSMFEDSECVTAWIEERREVVSGLLLIELLLRTAFRDSSFSNTTLNSPYLCCRSGGSFLMFDF